MSIRLKIALLSWQELLVTDRTVGSTRRQHSWLISFFSVPRRLRGSLRFGFAVLSVLFGPEAMAGAADEDVFQTRLVY